MFGTHERSFNLYSNEAFTPSYQADPSFPFPPSLFYTTFPETYNEYAAYGDLTWNLSKAFNITGGARYAYNDQRIFFDTQGAFWPPPLPQYVRIASHQGVSTWLGTARYRFTPDVMVYARVATGYRPGGPNSPLPNIPVTYKSDSLVNYEFGLKSTLLDHRALIDLSVYRIDWKNIQLIAATSQDILYEANGGRAISRGVELQSDYSPIQGLMLGLNAAYTDAHLVSALPESRFLLTGYQLPQVPKESVSATADYSFLLTEHWMIHAGTTYRYLGAQYAGLVEAASPVSTPTFQTAGYSVFDLNGSIQRNHLTFKVYIHNLANSRSLLAGGSTQGSVVTNAATGAETILATFLQPRTIGVGVDYEF